ncbi:MAG: penicillin-insensitive murein endopeptidase [Myxococcota bacterium]
MRWFCPLLMAIACSTPVPPGTTVSHGDSANGWLEGGVSLPDQGAGFVRARPGESTRFGTPRLVGALTRATLDVDARFGGAPLRVGDLSAPYGGRHRRHRSHRSGRDMDLIFYATDLEGRSVRGRGWVAFDRYGVGVEPADRGGRILRFDDARNWALVRNLLLDEEAQVQWIFVSRGLKARLLRYAVEHEPNPEALFRAAWLLHQPSRGNPHADHFHVRVACGPLQRSIGCSDRGPVWSWWRDAAAKRDSYAPYNDLGLVAAIVDGDVE